MIPGVTATALTFVSLIVCIVSYFVSYFNKNIEYQHFARQAFYFASALIFIQAVLLMWGIVTHQFQWQYVFRYSSLDLSAFYLITTFWGGQEGTFLLWLLLGSIYGMIIIRKRPGDEPLVMSFMALILAFIAMILIKKNPFTYVWDVMPAQFLPGEVPIDGNGLNPLLQDPWMIIHPPVLFTGYSSSMILFAFAMSALIRREYTGWIQKVYPYSLFVALSLGAGIILGGYWAYTTLGWGGYWGWDPVENSCFIPWLTSLALFHGILIQKKKGGLKRTNLFLALLTFILVLYGSFLTRSGVLSDFSVHSFSQSEINTYLVGFLLFFLSVAAVSFIFRLPGKDSHLSQGALFSRENFMLFGMISLLLSSVFTFFGTSAPLFSGLFLAEASDVSLEYYKLLNTPIAILLGFFIAISPLLNWGRTTMQKFITIRYHLILASLFTIGSYFFGLARPIHLSIFFLFILAISINAQIFVSMIRRKNWGFGGYLSHVGIGLMMIGIITSSAYETSIKTTLPLNTAKHVLDYDMTYTGFRTGSDGKEEAVIIVNGNVFKQLEAKPKFYWSEYNQAYMRNPSVHNLWLKDVYISPIQVILPDDQELGEKITILKDEQVHFEDYLIQFSGYEMDAHDVQAAQQVQISAVLNVIHKNRRFTVKPALKVAHNEQQNIPAILPASGRKIAIHDIDVEQKSLTLIIHEEKTLQAGLDVELLAVEITEKPLINLLWLGTILMIAGLCITFYFRIYRIKI